MDKRITIGGLVRMKSGGPKMVVIAISEEYNDITLQWYFDGVIRKGAANPVALEVIEEVYTR